MSLSPFRCCSKISLLSWKEDRTAEPGSAHKCVDAGQGAEGEQTGGSGNSDIATRGQGCPYSLLVLQEP